MPEGRQGYYAFISYSHADRACARWLHRCLEGYRLPARLVGSETALGPVPQKLAPIFKDREELGASGDLSTELQAALRDSRFLIVIASPAAAQSRWVNEEVRTFKRVHGDQRVLVLVAAGEPGASALPGREAEECFPEAVRHRVDADGRIGDAPAEPIAADLRPQGDGRRLAKLKLVAGLTGLRLDDLVQREAQRRQRRLAWLASAAVVGMLAMGALTLMAMQARNEAQQQRAEAEGLIEFMLTDLRAKLEPVGRLDVMDSVGQRALAYYGKQQPTRLDADALGRRSRALLLVGEVSNLRGDLDGALSTYTRAAETTVEQLRRDPDNGQRLFDHAQSVFWVGYIAWQRGDANTARRYFNQYLGYARRLALIDPANEDWAGEPAYAETSLGVLEMGQNRPATAFRHFDRTERIWHDLMARTGNPRQRTYDIAQAIAWKADAKRRMGEPVAALALRDREIALYRRLLAADANDNKAHEGLSVAYLRAAQLKLESGQATLGADLAATSLAEIQALQRQDPENRLWQEMAVKSANARTEALMLTGDWSQAAIVNQYARDNADALLKSDASVAAWRTDCLLPARWMQAAIAIAKGERSLAEDQLSRFRRDFAADSAGTSAEARFGWVMAHLLSAANARAQGKADQAHRDQAIARTYLASLGEPADARFRAAQLLAIAANPTIAPTPPPDSDAGYRLTALFQEASKGDPP